MEKINIREARRHFSGLLKKVEEGQEIIITRRNKEVARLVGYQDKRPELPALSDFREKISIKGEPMSKSIIKARDEERY